MNREGRGLRGAPRARPVAGPLAWLLIVFALVGPLVVNSHATPPALASTPAGTAATRPQVAPHADMQNSQDGPEGKPGVLGLPPKVHLIVNRTGPGAAPLAPVLAVLSVPADRTTAGIRVAAERAGIPPAGTLPRNSLWGRAPPRTIA